MKEGAQEVKSVGDSIKETISTSAGNVISHFLPPPKKKLFVFIVLLFFLFYDFIS